MLGRPIRTISSGSHRFLLLTVDSIGWTHSGVSINEYMIVFFLQTGFCRWSCGRSRRQSPDHKKRGTCQLRAGNECTSSSSNRKVGAKISEHVGEGGTLIRARLSVLQDSKLGK